jgi:hypothetical protein
MVPQLIRQDALRKPDDPDDTLDASGVSGIESSAADQEEFWNGVLSQFKRIIHGDEPGDWHADPTSIFGGDASLRALFLGGGGAGLPFEVDFASELVVEVDHNRNARPLVQVLVPLTEGWNSPSWNFPGVWNASGSIFRRLADPVIRHLSVDVFQVWFNSPTTGKVIYF